MDMRAAALRAGAYIGLGDGHFAAVLTVERRNAVTPPQLTGDTPVVYIFHPAQVGLGEAVGHELGLALVYYVHRGLGERRHLDEPLRRGHRLNGGAAAVAGAYVVLVVLNLDQPAAFLKVLYNRLAALVAVHALVLAAVCVDGRVLVEHENLLEVMALTISKSFGSWHGVTLTQPVPNSISTYSSPKIGISRFMIGRMQVLPMRCL